MMATCNNEVFGYQSAIVNISIPRGMDYLLPLFWTDESDVIIPLTGYTAEFEVLDKNGNQVLLLNNANVRAVVDEPAGKVTLTFEDTDSAVLTDDKMEYKLWLIDISENRENPMTGFLLS